MSEAQVRGFLERHALRASRDRGQNFLCDDALAERLVELAGVAAEDTVLEIGTGLGILTRALAARARRVVSLEVDAGLVRALREEAVLPANVELVHADALEADLAVLAAQGGGPTRLVANLPYAISGPLLRRLLELRELLVDWSVMLQHEVAARLVARPNTRAYGSLTVLHRLVAEVDRELRLSGGCFYPRPKVHSTFLRVRPLAEPLLEPGELPEVERLVRAGFGQRRKTLLNALRGAGVEATASQLEAAGVAPRARAEACTPEQLLALARALRSHAAP